MIRQTFRWTSLASVIRPYAESVFLEELGTNFQSESLLCIESIDGSVSLRMTRASGKKPRAAVFKIGRVTNVQKNHKVGQKMIIKYK